MVIVTVSEREVLKLLLASSTQWGRKGRISSPKGSASRSRQGRINANGKEVTSRILIY